MRSALLCLCLLAVPAFARGQGALRADYADIEALVAEIRQTPARARGRLLDRLEATCARFLDEHGPAASPAQLSLAGTTWLRLATRSGGDEEAFRQRVYRLKRFPELSPELARLVALQEARLDVRPGKPAPAWELPRLEEGVEPLGLKALRGKLVLLCFWSARNPTALNFVGRRLLALHQRWAGEEGFALVSLGSGAGGESPPEQAREVATHGLAWTQLHDAEGRVALRYGAAQLPFVCLVDEEGTVLALGPGWRELDAIERRIAEHLAPPGEDEGEDE